MTTSNETDYKNNMGGFPDESNTTNEPLQKQDSPCPGCEPVMMGNQFAHMVPGGCLCSEEEESSEEEEEEESGKPDQTSFSYREEVNGKTRRILLDSDDNWREQDDSISDILHEWALHGKDSLESHIPTHPEYVYRFSGEWKGWSNFLGCEDSTENHTRDALENMAFAEWFKNRLNDAGMYREDNWPAGVFERKVGGSVVAVGPTILVIALDGYDTAENALTLAAVHHRNPQLVP